MKFINLETEASVSDTLAMLSDNDRVNHKVLFDEKNGKPFMKVKEKNGRVIITCEMTGRATKDNGFGYLVGTYFSGKIYQKNGETVLRGKILTAPIYHALMLVFLVAIIAQAVYYRAFTIVPLLFIPIEFVMFYGEFKKQGYIQRYMYRAFKRLISETTSN